MVAGPFVSQRAIDDDEVRRRRHGINLTSRGEVEEKAASACKQLLGNKDGEWRANGVADDADGVFRQLKGVKIGMVAGPRREPTCLPAGFEVSDDVAVGIKDAHRRDILDRQMLLTTGFAQQGLRIEDRWLAMVLMIENGSTFSHVMPGTIARRLRHSERASLRLAVRTSPPLQQGGDACHKHAPARQSSRN
jgi:hypothetical protein